MIASALLAVLVQAGMPDSVRITGEPSPFSLFAGRTLFIAHPLGTFEPRPARLSQSHQDAIDRARVLYDRREFGTAAALLAPVYRDEPDNLFVADEYARTLFWLDDRRNESFDVYRRLTEQLDRQHDTNDRQVAIDSWFSEAYWKIGSLYLDRQNWERAAFEITRFLALGSSQRPEALEQVYTYLAEAYVHLERTDLARWAAEQALRQNPRNQDAVRYLRQLGPPAREWPTRHIFSCQQARDTCVRAYSFHKAPVGHPGLGCIAPREEPQTPLSPCLRIGWTYVGQRRQEWSDWPSAGISFEIVNDRVYSIRLWRLSAIPPAPLRRGFMRFR